MLKKICRACNTVTELTNQIYIEIAILGNRYILASVWLLYIHHEEKRKGDIHYKETVADSNTEPLIGSIIVSQEGLHL
jgi:hypothetical protein